MSGKEPRRPPAPLLQPLSRQKLDRRRVLAREAVQQEGGIGDRPGKTRSLGPDRKPMPGGKDEVRRDTHAERQGDRLDLAQREDTEFGTAKAEIGQPILCRPRNYVELAAKRGGLAGL